MDYVQKIIYSSIYPDFFQELQTTESATENSLTHTGRITELVIVVTQATVSWR
jgi:hypothetical protein